MKVKIRKGDTVEVISGRLEDKGKRGEVIRVLPDDSRVVVQGVNLRKKHQRQGVGVPHLRELKRLFVQVQHVGQRRIGRTSVGHDVGLGEDLKAWR